MLQNIDQNDLVIQQLLQYRQTLSMYVRKKLCWSHLVVVKRTTKLPDLISHQYYSLVPIISIPKFSMFNTEGIVCEVNMTSITTYSELKNQLLLVLHLLENLQDQSTLILQHHCLMCCML